MALREILLELGIEVDKNAQKKAENSVDNLTNKLGKLKNFAIGAGAVFLTGRIAQGFAAMITSAGDAAEIVNKFGAVFIEETDDMAKAMQRLATDTGQSRIELQQLSADAGSLVKPLVGSTEETAKLAQTMTEAALDISSFENVLPTDALRAIKSAIIGSSEPMLQFGVDTRQAALAQFALEKGLTTSIKSMSTAEVTALRMELIMSRLGTKGALGDATKTAGSFTNRLRGLRGALKDASADIGKELLPVATELLVVMLDLVKAIGPGLAKAAKASVPLLKAIASVFTAIAQAATGTNSTLFAMSTLLLGLGIAFQAVGVAATIAGLKAAAAWVLAALPFIIFGGLLFLIIEDLKKMGEGHKSVTGQMIQGINDLIDEYGSLGAAISEMIGTALEEWLKFFGVSKEDSEKWADDLREIMNFNPFEAWLQGFNDFVESTKSSLINVADDFLELVGAGSRSERLAQRPSRRTSTEALGESVGAFAAAGMAGPAQSSLIGSPAGAGGNVMTSNVDLKVEVDASGQDNPEAIGDAVGQQIEVALARRDRQTMQAFTVATPDNG
jgi:hypothetical protein